MSVREMSVRVLGPKQSYAPALTFRKLVKENLLWLSFSAGHMYYIRMSSMSLEMGEMSREAREWPPKMGKMSKSNNMREY